MTLEYFKSSFKNHSLTSSANNPKWLQTLKDNAWKNFENQGFPSKKDEEYKYTNLKPLAEKSFNEIALLTDLPLFELDYLSKGINIVFINGIYSENHSTSTKFDGVTIKSLAKAFHENKEEIEAVLKNQKKESAIESLNLAFLNDGTFINIDKNKSAKAPIHLIYVTTNDVKSPIIYPRNIIVANELSKATITENYLSANTGEYFLNAVTDFYLKDSAHINHYQVQLEQNQGYAVQSTRVTQEKNSHYQNFHLSFGSHILRHNLNVDVKGENAFTKLAGLYAVKENHHADHHTLITHHVPHCHSEQVYKGIIEDNGNGVFNGKVIVHKEAQQTNANQLNKNMLLGKKAEANTKPELIISADDVKCSHGATVGQISKEELFYLESRGIPYDQAIKMLIEGFAKDVINDITNETIQNGFTNLLKKEFLNKLR